MKNKVLIATVTNAAYGLAGWAMLDYSSMLLNVGLCCVLLMLGSAYHHYHLQEWSRKYDYFGMYAVLLGLICTFLGWIWIYGFMVALGGALIVTIGRGSSRGIVGVGIGLVWILLFVKQGAFEALHVASWMSVAFVFNMMGDDIHSDAHDWIHGLGWHVPSAYAILLTAKYLI